MKDLLFFGIYSFKKSALQCDYGAVQDDGKEIGK